MADNNGDIDLSLGLSLNGRFRVDPKRGNIKVPPNIPPPRRDNVNPMMSPSSSVTNLEMMGGGGNEIKSANIILPPNLPPRRSNINPLMSPSSSVANLDMMGGGGNEIKRANIILPPNLPPRRGNINPLMSPSSSVANLDMMGGGGNEINKANIILPPNLPPRRGNINPLMSQSSYVPNLEMMGGGGGKEIKEGSSSETELAKTCSLPVDVKRKRKELLTMKRMEAKLKTWGKLISGNGLRREMEIPFVENEGGDCRFAYLQELRRCGIVGSGGFSEIFNPFQIPVTSTTSAQSLPPRVNEKAIQTSKSVGGVENSKAAQKAKAIKTSKSGGGVENSKAAQKAKSIKTSKSGGGVENSKATQKAKAIKTSKSGGGVENSKAAQKAKAIKTSKSGGGVENSKAVQKARGGVEDTESAQEESKTDQIPSVITTGPDGNTVKGFLYKYKKGEQVKIVCSCHGKFLSPTGFVKHAGVRDVGNPMKQIIVTNPSI